MINNSINQIKVVWNKCRLLYIFLKFNRLKTFMMIWTCCENFMKLTYDDLYRKLFQETVPCAFQLNMATMNKIIYYSWKMSSFNMNVLSFHTSVIKTFYYLNLYKYVKYNMLCPGLKLNEYAAC